MSNRRNFLGKLLTGAAGITIAQTLQAEEVKSVDNISNAVEGSLRWNVDYYRYYQHVRLDKNKSEKHYNKIRLLVDDTFNELLVIGQNDFIYKEFFTDTIIKIFIDVELRITIDSFVEEDVEIDYDGSFRNRFRENTLNYFSQELRSRREKAAQDHSAMIQKSKYESGDVWGYGNIPSCDFFDTFKENS